MYEQIKSACHFALDGFISDKRISDLIQLIMERTSTLNEVDVVCVRCGSINDYRTEQAGPHIKAICNGCDRYIKFLSKNFKQPGSGNTHNNMADIIIKGRINVEKIFKEWLFKGEKGTYLDFTVFYNNSSDSYGNNGMIVQDVPTDIYKKEVADKISKDKMTKGEILGNVKNSENLSRKEGTPGYRGKEETKAAPSGTEAAAAEEEDNLPF